MPSGVRSPSLLGAALVAAHDAASTSNPDPPTTVALGFASPAIHPLP